MTVLRKINNWVSKHWSIIRQNPENGEHAAREIEPILKEMHDNNLRVSKAVQRLQNETATVKRMMADGSIVNDNRT